jgi:hypothetical protein
MRKKRRNRDSSRKFEKKSRFVAENDIYRGLPRKTQNIAIPHHNIHRKVLDFV